ncbi:MAG: response regulator [Anaerolineaceae bacterium]|nr:response regulator [Anaerolineaceae bacterium]
MEAKGRIVSGEQILVVDDGRENREFIVEYILHPNNYKALLARDGKEGLEMALEHRPDLILLDLQMPRMDGIEVLKRLAAYHLDIPVILMTFHGSEDIAIEVYRLGVRDYIRKPYTVEEMLGAIDRSLTETRLRREKEALTDRLIRANRELQARLQEMNVLYGIGKSVTELTNMAELLPRIVEAAVQVSHSEEGFIALIVNERLICRAQKRAGGRTQPAQFEINNPVAEQAIQTNQSVLLTRDEMDGSVAQAPQCVTAVPLNVHGHTIGVLQVSNVSPDAPVFTRHEVALLSTLSDYAAIAIENSRNMEQIRRTSEVEKVQIRSSFERLVPPSVVEQVLNNPDDLRLGGTRQEISVLFADIRGYTSWSENAPPERVVEMLNDHLSLTAEIILGWDGTLDKYFGDGLMAIFNAPTLQSDHVHRAADAALALMRAGEEKRAQRGDTLNYSIGVHVGEAVVGYIGTDRAMNYTAIGDVVNTAKRLQELAPPGQIWVEQAVVDNLGDLIHAKSLGEIKIRGRKQPARAYQLLGLAPRR